ncbi:unnamed protein product, partial [marine sediment metagenome]
MTGAKIICTMGPSCSDEQIIERLVASGMNIARINFSYGNHDEYKAMISIIRKVSSCTGEPIGIIGDLSGPKIRIGELESETVDLLEGNDIMITTREVSGNANEISTTYPNLVSDVEKGDRILIDDGRIELKVSEIKPEEVRATVVIGGVLKPHKGMNLPGVNVSAPAICAKDFKDIELAVNEGIDFLALSFVRNPEDIIKAKKMIAN